MSRIFSVLLLLGSVVADKHLLSSQLRSRIAVRSTSTLASGKGGGGSNNNDKPNPDDSCITTDEVKASIKAWTASVVQIGNAYRCGAPDDDSCEGNKKDCAAAGKHASAVIDVAYGYKHNEHVLFKPTYTTVPNTYRDTYNGALSYFIGTDCMAEIGEKFLDTSGKIVHDDGFAINNSPDGQTLGWSAAEAGGVNSGKDFVGGEFQYRVKGNSCHQAVAQGPICFTARSGKGNGCVDKTFAYVKVEGAGVPLVLVTHHSSVRWTGKTEC